MYVIIVVILSFTIFNANNLNEVIISFKNMFGFNNLPFINNEFIYYLKSYLILIVLGIIFSTPIVNNYYNKLKQNKLFNYISILIIFVLLIFLLLNIILISILII